jgi:hypothetical protein
MPMFPASASSLDGLPKYRACLRDRLAIGGLIAKSGFWGSIRYISSPTANSFPAVFLSCATTSASRLACWVVCWISFPCV